MYAVHEAPSCGYWTSGHPSTRQRLWCFHRMGHSPGNMAEVQSSFPTYVWLLTLPRQLACLPHPPGHSLGYYCPPKFPKERASRSPRIARRDFSQRHGCSTPSFSKPGGLGHGELGETEERAVEGTKATSVITPVETHCFLPSVAPRGSLAPSHLF